MLSPHATRRTLPWSLALALTACSGSAPPTEPARATPPPAPSSAPSPAPLAAVDPTPWILAADRRRLDDSVRAALLHPDPGLRRLATRAVARVHDPNEAPLLERGLRDPDPGVRGWAGLGLGALEAAAPESAARALAAALASEPHPDVRGGLVRDLARLPGDPVPPALDVTLRSQHPAEQAGACAAVGELAIRGRSIPAAVRARVAALLGPRDPTEVRLACAFAMARLPAPADAEAPGERVALVLASADPDPEVRAFVVRALGRQPAVELDTLERATRDADWRVAVQAFRALGPRAALETGTVGVRRYAGALDRAHERATASGELASGGLLHVLLTALEAAAPIARSAPIAEVAVRLHRQLGELPADTPATRDRGLAHCAAAELVDRGRGWPSRLETCGLEQVLPHERQAQIAGVLADLDGSEAARVALLGRLVRAPEPVLREAVLAAAARIWHPDATALVLRAVREDPDPGVLAAAMEALAGIARRAPTETEVPPPLDSSAALRALQAARARLPEVELESLLAWLAAVEAVDARALTSPVQALALNPSHAVRERARAVLARWEAPRPTDPVPGPPNPVEAAELPSSEARPRVVLHTDRGELVLELRPDVAPVTVARFLRLARGGTYDGLSFHRVVPGFVVQGGDPRGDGYGGPGYWQRCEDSRLPYARGTVGMALAGRDTGGSQFFITHAAQPHLEARHTAFGQVVEGLEALDRLQVGDRIRRVEVR